MHAIFDNDRPCPFHGMRLASVTTAGRSLPSGVRRSSAVGLSPAAASRFASCSGRQRWVVHCTGTPPYASVRATSSSPTCVATISCPLGLSVDHPRRQVHARDVDTPLHQVGRHGARPATDIQHGPQIGDGVGEDVDCGAQPRRSPDVAEPVGRHHARVVVGNGVIRPADGLEVGRVANGRTGHGCSLRGKGRSSHSRPDHRHPVRWSPTVTTTSRPTHQHHRPLVQSRGGRGRRPRSGVLAGE